MKQLIEEIIKEEQILELRLTYLRELKKLYIDNAITPLNPSVKDILFELLRINGESDVEELAVKSGKSTKTIDNLLRSLVKEKRVKVSKEGKKNKYSVV